MYGFFKWNFKYWCGLPVQTFLAYCPWTSNHGYMTKQIHWINCPPELIVTMSYYAVDSNVFPNSKIISLGNTCLFWLGYWDSRLEKPYKPMMWRNGRQLFCFTVQQLLKVRENTDHLSADTTGTDQVWTKTQLFFAVQESF